MLTTTKRRRPAKTIDDQLRSAIIKSEVLKQIDSWQFVSKVQRLSKPRPNTQRGVCAVVEQIQDFGFVLQVGELAEIEDDKERREELGKTHQTAADHALQNWGGRFDFLGYHLTRRGLRAATVTIEKSTTHVRRLYEQGADPIRIGQYVQRWRKWATSGVLPKFSIIPMKNGRP